MSLMAPFVSSSGGRIDVRQPCAAPRGEHVPGGIQLEVSGAYRADCLENPSSQEPVSLDRGIPPAVLD
jgi:hypothetical protein